MGRIVVGVDGSEQSAAALRWAVDEARLRGASIDAVHVYELQPTLAYGYATAPIAPEVIDQTTQGARERAGQLLDEALGAIEAGDVVIEPVLIEETGTAAALVERSRGADLLVVGSRGRGGFQELLLGSVSHQCASHALCPVVILRSAD